METPPHDESLDGADQSGPATNTSPQTRLRSAATSLCDKLRHVRTSTAANCATLEQQIREARARQHRRAAYNARDKACYRLGGAFEPFGGLDLDDVTMAGFFSQGQAAVLLLVEAAQAKPDADLVELLRGLFVSPTGSALRAAGVYHRWIWLQRLYHEEVETFLSSRKGRDPKARWRSDKPTTNQNYLVAETSRLLQIVTPRFANRGAAFDWIKAQGGNPRFLTPPSAVDRVSVEASSQ